MSRPVRKLAFSMIALALMAVSYSSSATPPTPPPPPTPPANICAKCVQPTPACYANGGTNCTPPAGVPHCSATQVANCVVWFKPLSPEPEEPTQPNP